MTNERPGPLATADWAKVVGLVVREQGDHPDQIGPAWRELESRIRGYASLTLGAFDQLDDDDRDEIINQVLACFAGPHSPKLLAARNPSGLFRTIFYCRAIDNLRRRATGQSAYERYRRNAAHDAAFASDEESEHSALVRRAVRKLPTALRPVIQLALEGLRLPEIAQILNIRYSAAGVRLHRATKKLQKLLGHTQPVAPPQRRRARS